MGVGARVGMPVMGLEVGLEVGLRDGDFVGLDDGFFVGLDDGDFVGLDVGAEVVGTGVETTSNFSSVLATTIP